MDAVHSKTDAASPHVYAQWQVVGAIGVGVDLCSLDRFRDLGRGWRRRARTLFTEDERSRFGADLAVAWSVREAVIKALGYRSVLGAPLSEMQVTGSWDDLRYAPVGRARSDLDGAGRTVELRAWEQAGSALVVAVVTASAGQAPAIVGVAAGADQGAPSWSARYLAERAVERIASERKVPFGVGPWTGGKTEAARWTGEPGALVSLSHDAGDAAAAVLVAEEAS